jgi:hypothetical protein
LLLEFIKILLIFLISPISASTPCCGNFGENKSKEL